MLKRRVLIFHSGALGDFIMTWPTAVALARVYPQSRISYVTSAGKGKLAEAVLGVEWTDVEGGWHGLFQEQGSLPEPPLKMLTGAHTVVSFVADADSPWTRNVRRIAGDIPILNVAPPLCKPFDGHASEFILQQLTAWPIVSSATEQILRSVAEKGLGRGYIGGGDVVIHPGSGSREKCWPIERFTELANTLRKQGRSARFIVGEVELDRWNAGELDRLRESAPVTPLTQYTDLNDQLKSASAFVGNDSGPAHLAGVMGVPTVAIFGTSRPENWHPMGPRVAVVSADQLSAISVEQVLCAIPESAEARATIVDDE